MTDEAPKARSNMPRGRPFAKGEGGRRPGSRNKATLAVEALLSGEAETLTRTAINLALAGDTVALRLCLERLCPPRRDRAVALRLPAIETVADLPMASASIIAAVGSGQITPSEGEQLGRLVAAHAVALQTGEFEERLRSLEAQQKDPSWQT
jgi:hypothetical protein